MKPSQGQNSFFLNKYNVTILALALPFDKGWFSAREENWSTQAKNRAKKVAAEQELGELSEHPNKVFKLVKSMKKDGKDVEGGRCMRGSDGRLNFSKKDRGRVWKEHMERIMNDSRQSSIRNSELCTGLFFFTCQVRVLDTTIYNNNNLHSQCKFCLQPAFHQYY